MEGAVEQRIGAGEVRAGQTAAAFAAQSGVGPTLGKKALIVAIVLVLVALAVIAALGICVALVVSVVLGILLAKTGTPRFIVAILLFVIPSGAIGAAAGAILIGRMAYGANQSAILLGPLAGLILGGFTGATMGAGAGMLWFRRKREDLPELPTES